jgi:hypothetical protein
MAELVSYIANVFQCLALLIDVFALFTMLECLKIIFANV